MKVKQTVMVIDDDRTLRRPMRTMLQRHGFFAEFFSDVESFCREGTWDKSGCVLVELQSPGAELVAITHQFRELEILTPFVVVTRSADVPTAVDAMKAGAVDFFLKPVTESALIDAVRRSHRLEIDIRRNHVLQLRVRSVVANLSDKELHVLDGLLSGKSNKVISSELNVTIKTIEYYRGTLKQKFNVNTIAELMALTLPFRNGKRHSKSS